MSIEKIGQSLAFLSREHRRYLNHYLKHLGLGEKLFSFYMAVLHHTGISQKELSSLLGVDKGDTAKTIKKLEDLGYIERRVDVKDQRFNTLHLSKKGFAIESEVRSILDRLDRLVSAPFSSIQITQLIKTLDSFTESIKTELEDTDEDKT